MPGRNLTLVLALTGAATLAGCSDSKDHRPDAITATGYNATVHRTEAGFPHIVAEDFGSLGYGTGYAAAQDNFCILARNVLRLRGQMAEYLGPAEENLDNDFFRAYMEQSGIFEADVSPEMEYLYAGYAAGFNAYLRQTGVDNITDDDCRGAQWIQPMTANDLRRAELTPAFLPRLATLFLAAEPPEPVAQLEKGALPAGASEGEFARTEAFAGKQSLSRRPLSQEARLELAQAITDMATARDKGSNGVAIGSDLTNHSGGMLFTNPHLDWDLSFRFYPRHQIIPGVTNLLGANTYERVLVGFGTNGDVAFTNTVTASRTQALYELELVPGNPLAYIFDGQEEAIQQIPVTVKVLGEDGNLSEASHTFYESRHGLIMGLVFGWDDANAYALRIADEGNRGANGQLIESARAKSVRELKEVLNRYQASPNINIIAADSSGEAFYGDLGPVANMTDAQLKECASDTLVLISFFAPAFRGNTSDCEWNTDSDSAAPGILGASKRASIFRRDYATNSNDSFWLANPNEPITGIPMVQGDIEDERTLRTRSGLTMLSQRQQGTDGLGGNTFTVDTLLERMLSNQNYAGQILVDDLVTLCRDNPEVELGDEMVDISAACPVLAAWDRASNLDSRGAHLFREFMRAANDGSVSGRTLPPGLNYAVPFDVADPVHTPRGLDTTDNPLALQALASAVRFLEDAGIALDARLGDIQSVTRGGMVIPMHGGEEGEGVFNKMSLDYVEGEGYPAVTGSSASWVMAVEFADSGVLAKGLLSYSISANTESPHYADMTELFSRKEFLDLPYTLEEVEATALSTEQVSEGTGDCIGEGWQSFAEPQFADETACRNYFADIEANQLLDFVAQ